MYNSEIQYYDFDGFRVDVKKHRLLKNGEPILLTPKAFRILQILIENSGQVVEREAIYAKLWANSFVEESNLTQYIYTLRKILGRNPAGASYIETVARHGYIFSAQVEKVFSAQATTEARSETVSGENDSSPRAAAVANEASEKISQAPGAPDFNPTSGAQTPHSKKNRQTLLPDLPAKNRGLAKGFFLKGLFLALIVASSLFIYFQTGKYETKTSPAVNSLAILPFQPIDEKSREDKLGLGMADAIIMRFTRLKKIPVRPTSAIFRFTDHPAADVISIGRELNVDAILEGTVQRDGERVRVSVQMINVSDGRLLWTEKFDEKFTDIFALQDSISGKVSQSLSLKLTPPQLDALQQRPTNNPEAYEAYQLGV
jgi:TolB-like protein/DNA-binding winged helix-turn-helix (wHTH) protein